MRIVIDGKPIPKKSVRLGKYGAYNPQKKLMDGIKLIILSQCKGKQLMVGAVKLSVTYYMPIPESYSDKKKDNIDRTHHINRPDTDNLTKLIKDCMSGIVYKDDSQVAVSSYVKVYDKNPRTEIYITGL